MSDIMETVMCPTKDPNWIIKLLFSYVALIPLVGMFFLSGYQLKAIREYAREPKFSMPEWDNWGQLLIDGIMLMLIAMVYMLVPAILMFVSFLPMILTAVGAAGATSDNSAVQAISTIVAIGGPVLTLILMAVSSILMFIAAIMMPMAMGIYAVSGSFFAAINPFGVFGKVLGNLGSYIMVLLIPALVGFVINIVLGITVVGSLLVFPAMLYTIIVSSKMMGDMLRENNICS